ncbi:MAG: HD domain-containing protein [Chloroflexi bacterium]|nr:HD domain-containing protein [Chloroflexota bacterium]
MGFLQRSLTAKLSAFFLLLAIVPLAVAGYMAYDSGRQSIARNVEAHLESVAILKEQEIQTWVEHLEHAVAWLAASPQIVDDATVLARYATDTRQYLAAHDSLVAELDRMAALGHTSLVSLLDGASGQVIASSDTAWEGRFGDAEPYFIQGKQGAYVSDIFHSLSLGRPTMVVAAPVKDSSGRLVGVLAAHADLEPLSEVMLERSGLGESGETFLVNRSNLLLTNTVFAPDGAFKKWIFGQGAELALAGKSGVGQWVDYRGKPVIGAFRWLDDRKLALIAKQDQAEAFVPIVALRHTMQGISIAVILSATLLAVFFARTITRPLRQLVEGAEEIGRGNLDYRIEVGVRDEIGQLAQAFNQMTENLQAITASRDELNREIAERVRAEEALRESEQRLSTLISQTPAVIYSLIVSDDLPRITYISQNLRNVLGFEPDEFIDNLKLWGECLHPDDAPKILNASLQLLKEGRVTIEEYRFQDKQGKYHWLYDEQQLIIHEDGTLEVIGAWHDITDRKRAEEELRQSYVQLQRALEGTVNTLVSAIEIRDPYTGGHQRRVTQLACAIANEMGLPEEQIEGIRMAGLIHDLGKITVPAEILSKPSELTELEFGLIKMHPKIGYDVLKEMDFPWPVAQIVLQHHERVDGSGYPQGLSGEEIILEARILGVADVVEAMASHRPYRPARGIDEALEEISQGRGRLYDTEAVDACLKLFTEKGFELE